jgi:hypothetical protein
VSQNPLRNRELQSVKVTEASRDKDSFNRDPEEFAGKDVAMR